MDGTPRVAPIAGRRRLAKRREWEAHAERVMHDGVQLELFPAALYAPGVRIIYHIYLSA